MKLEDKVAVITGGNSGIGLATAKEFRQQGARVAILGRSAETLEQAHRAIGGEVLAVQGDVCRLADLDAFYARVKRELGPIDVLVANAGVAKFAPVSVLSEEIFDELCDINFKGAFFTVQKAIPLLRDGASVILVGTAGADQGRMGTSVYAATKVAVRSLARAFSLELLPRRIRVNILTPE